VNQAAAARLIAAVDLRRRFRSRSFLVQAIGGPVALATIISLTFGSASGFEATIGVVDADGSPVASAFVRGVTEAGAGHLRFELVDTPDQARSQVDDGELGAAVVIPEGFGASLGGATPGEVEVITAPDSPIAAEVARAVAQGFTARVNAARLAAATTAAAGGEVPSDAELAGIELPVDVDQTGTGGDVSPAAYFGPAMGLLFLFLSVGAVARDLLAEKRMRVLDRVRAAPVRATTILAGKAASVVVVGIVALGVIWAITAAALGADWGDPLGVALVIVAVSLAVAGLAGVVAAVARTEVAADTLATVVAFVFALIGGNFFPPGILPDGLRRASLLTPNGWALQGFAELSVGGGAVVDVVPHALVLVAWALATGGLAALLLSRRIGAGQ
jgi:ABC-2 type transport system permease protein